MKYLKEMFSGLGRSSNLFRKRSLVRDYPFVAVQGFRVQGSEVVAHVQSNSLIDKPQEKPDKNRDSRVRWGLADKNCTVKFVNV